METFKETEEAVVEGGLGVGELGEPGEPSEPGGSVVVEPKIHENERVVYDLNEDDGFSSMVVVNRRIVVAETTTVEMRFVGSENIEEKVMEKGDNLVENLGGVIEQDGNFEGANGNLAEDKERVGEDFAVGDFAVIKQDRNFEGTNGNLEEDKKRVGEDFAVGDFVWGKIKGQTWWPGQVYDPSDASEFASKFKHEDQLLVAYFGDGSCAWCFPTQLVPFVAHFEEMSKQNNSRTLENAVKKALDEIGRRVELKMICSCVAGRDRLDLVRPEVVNAGVKPGVLVPEGDIGKLWLKYSSSYEPAEVLEFVKRVARVGSVDDMLELVALKSWLSAFYWVGRRCSLATYHEPLQIPGLEDKSEKVVSDTSDFSVPIEVPIKGPIISELNQRRKQKQKSVAELMGKGRNDKPKSHRKTEKKTESVANEEIQLDETPLSHKRTHNEDSGDHIEGEEALEKSHTSRERKKSKYLSPPYTSHSWIWWKQNKEREPESVSETRETRAREDITEAPISKSTSDVKKTVEGQISPRIVFEKEKKIVEFKDVNVSVSEVLSELRSAGVDLMSLEDGSIEMIKGFVTAFRSSTYLNGSNYESYHKEKFPGKKPKSVEPERRPKSRVTKLQKDTPTVAATKASPVSLIVTFTPGAALLSKDDIVKIFSKYGNVNEEETNVFLDSNFAEVAYTRIPEAEEALRECIKQSPLGRSGAGYKLRYSVSASARALESNGGQKVSESPKKRAASASAPALAIESNGQKVSKKRARRNREEEISQVDLVKAKLEKLKGMVEKCDGKVSGEEKSGMEKDMKRLLKKVRGMAVKKT